MATFVLVPGGRVARQVRPDACVPDDGDPRRPQPLASFLQTVRLTGALAQVPHREFVHCPGWADRTPFTELRTRLMADPARRVQRLPTGHDAMHETPEADAALLATDLRSSSDHG
ncbi:hypothetical protein [Streptacidiphilus neutrinimicus]|uniref:hypothetical protein n=1 Tax=Streptacidiphilus neutrinimicus TaxID=105420 RepID=UPI000AC44843|nr:hypothetical protein [Streptacidiphilus neutrinimicus]